MLMVFSKGFKMKKVQLEPTLKCQSNDAYNHWTIKRAGRPVKK
jgi:hypothetical protein